ncbi:hypothetical protein MVEN_00566600 [Mycena venus]|uniref:Uncharacterized protein n=1 Tax=Mycena venus TaxID=2733690 RepID=A0A8H6YND8_9AGAR|nr:hypothetical protein MVEN_00566600 [Mycena venus]
MPDPPLPNSPFRGRVAHTAQPAIRPLDTSLFKKPHPAGDFLIVRGIYIPDDLKNGPLDKLNERIAEIRAAATGDLKHTRLVTASLAQLNGFSTSCSIRLDPIHGPEKGEPRVDLLQEWADALAERSPFWEVCWAPRGDGRDRRMWVRVSEVFATEGTKGVKDPSEEKVISTIRTGFDDAGFQTMDGYRLGQSKHVILTMARPGDVDHLLRKGKITIPALARDFNLWSGGRQLEARAPFELVVGGFASNDDSAALEACRSWFGTFHRGGTPLLVETRTDPKESDFAIFTMHDWTATADVLSSVEDFQATVGSVYCLTNPTLLYKFNSATTKSNVQATITANADALKEALAAVNNRIDANERDARARDAEMKARLTNIDSTLSTVVAAAKDLAQKQMDQSRSLYVMQQENTLSLQLARIDSEMYNARREFAHPVDDNEKKEAGATIATLKAQRAEVDAKLAALRGVYGSLMLVAPGPEIQPPQPATAPPPIPNPNPNKRPRTSLNGPSPNGDDANGRNDPVQNSDDVPMPKAPTSG